MSACACCESALRDIIRGTALLTALGGLASLLFGLHCLVPLGAAAALDASVAWFSWVLCIAGAILLVLGLTASLGSWCGATAPMHVFTGACTVLAPLQALLVWAYVAHPKQLDWLAARDQTYALSAILEWVTAHQQVAAALAAMWLLLQGTAVVLGAAFVCCPGGRRRRHPWSHYWSGEDDGREPLLLPRRRGDASAGSGSPRGAGFHTPPSRFQSPYQSPARAPPPGGPLVVPGMLPVAPQLAPAGSQPSAPPLPGS